MPETIVLLLNVGKTGIGAAFIALIAIGCTGKSDALGDAGFECPEEAIKHEDSCLFQCPEGWYRNEQMRCEPECREGWMEIADTCVLPCPPELETLEDGIGCRPMESEVGLHDCEIGEYDIAGGDQSGQILYVSEANGEDFGNGTVENPCRTLDQALQLVSPEIDEVGIALAEGSYEIGSAWDSIVIENATKIHLMGQCSNNTEITLGGKWTIEVPGLSIRIARTRISGDSIQVGDLDELVLVENSINVEISRASTVSENRVVVENNILTNQDGHCISVISEGNPEIEIRQNIFESCGAEYIMIYPETAAVVESNWFIVDEAQTAIAAYGDDQNGVLTLNSNWFKGGQTRTLVLSNWTGLIELKENTFTEERGTSIWVDEVESLDMDRITSVGDEIEQVGGVYIRDSENVLIKRALLIGNATECLSIEESTGIEIEDAQIQGCKYDSMRIEHSEEISIKDSVIKAGERGLAIVDSSVHIENIHNGANTSVGVRIRADSDVAIRNSTITGNGSTGIDIAQMGQSETVIEGCEIGDNTGIGVLVRSGGETNLFINNNRIVGTRTGTVQNAQGQGVVGDGIAVLTGTDGVASRATLQGNTVTGNSRLGILAHGEGTTVQCDDTTFGPGNGYNGYVSELTEGSADLILQAGGQVTGADGALAQQPETDLFVEANPGGGDPH